MMCAQWWLTVRFLRKGKFKNIVTISIAAASVATLPFFLSLGEANAAPPHGPLVWSDDFNSFNSTKWRKGPDGWSDRYGDIAQWDPNLVTVANSKLRLRVEKRGGLWVGGLIHARDRLAWTYGYFEICAKVPAGQGLWSALWMMPAANAYGYWPRSGEIDILEHLGRTGEVTNGYSTIHFANGRSPGQVYRVATGKNWSQDWHTWGRLWDKTPDGREYFRFYVDNVQYGAITEKEWPAVPGGPPGSPFDKAFYPIFNLAVGGPWAGSPSLSISGKYLEIDWISRLSRSLIKNVACVDEERAEGSVLLYLVEPAPSGNGATMALMMLITPGFFSPRRTAVWCVAGRGTRTTHARPSATGTTRTTGTTTSGFGCCVRLTTFFSFRATLPAGAGRACACSASAELARFRHCPPTTVCGAEARKERWRGCVPSARLGRLGQAVGRIQNRGAGRISLPRRPAAAAHSAQACSGA